VKSKFQLYKDDKAPNPMREMTQKEKVKKADSKKKDDEEDKEER
jgi:hypothetical protein